MPQDDVSFVVFASPFRPEVTARCLESLRASDIGERFAVCMQADGKDPRQHWKETHELAAWAPTPWVVVFEDDCLVNRHIVHNIRTWKWKDDPKFGAGWLYNPGAYKGGHDAWYDDRHGPWYGTVGVLYPTELLRHYIPYAMQWMEQRNNLAWDWAISAAIFHTNRKIRVHGPPLVEHLHQAPSTMGHQHSWSFSTTRGSFRPDWQRPPSRA